VVDKEVVVKEEDVVAASVSSRVPPVEAVYQRNVPELEEEAPRVTVPASHCAPFVTVGIGGVPKIVAVTAVRVLKQEPLSNST